MIVVKNRTIAALLPSCPSEVSMSTSRKRRSRHADEVIILSDDDAQEPPRRVKRHNANDNGKHIILPIRAPKDDANDVVEVDRRVGVKRMGASLVSQHEIDRPSKRRTPPRATEKLVPPPPQPQTTSTSTQQQDNAALSSTTSQQPVVESPPTELDASAALLKSLHEERLKRKARSVQQTQTQTQTLSAPQRPDMKKAAAPPVLTAATSAAPASFYSQFLSLSFDSSRPWGAAVTDTKHSRNDTKKQESAHTSHSLSNDDNDHNMSDR